METTGSGETSSNNGTCCIELNIHALKCNVTCKQIRYVLLVVMSKYVDTLFWLYKKLSITLSNIDYSLLFKYRFPTLDVSYLFTEFVLSFVYLLNGLANKLALHRPPPGFTELFEVNQSCSAVSSDSLLYPAGSLSRAGPVNEYPADGFSISFFLFILDHHNNCKCMVTQ